MVIPRVIHRIWLGDTPMPAEFEAFGDSWARHHPGWEMKLWRSDDLPPLRAQDLFDSATSLAQKADIARYEVLLHYGGVYIDTDFECLRPLDELLDGAEVVIGTEDGSLMTNALIGAVPGHPVLEAIVECLPASVAADPNGLPAVTTGPHLVTRVINSDAALRSAVRVIAQESLYPYLWNECYRCDEEFPHAYAVHHWAGSWITETPRQVPPRYRLIVVPDWDRPASAAAVIARFARLFGSQDPIELILAVRDEPGVGDLERARNLLTTLNVDPTACAPLSLESFCEAMGLPYDVAVVPSAQHDQLIFDVANAVAWLYDTRSSIDAVGRPALAAVHGRTVLMGDGQALRYRLAMFEAALV